MAMISRKATIFSSAIFCSFVVFPVTIGKHSVSTHGSDVSGYPIRQKVLNFLSLKGVSPSPLP